MPTGNLNGARPIPDVPWIVQSVDPAVHAFLVGLPEPSFETLADPKVRWAVNALDAAGTAETGGGSAYVVSGETYRYLKAHRY
jgi:hypothetical protein